MQQNHGEKELCKDTVCNTKIQDKIAKSEIETPNAYSFPPHCPSKCIEGSVGITITQVIGNKNSTLVNNFINTYLSVAKAPLPHQDSSSM